MIRLCREWHSGGIIFPGGTCADVPLLWAADVLLCEADGNGMGRNEMVKRGKTDEERNECKYTEDERQGENERSDERRIKERKKEEEGGWEERRIKMGGDGGALARLLGQHKPPVEQTW